MGSRATSAMVRGCGVSAVLSVKPTEPVDPKRQRSCNSPCHLPAVPGHVDLGFGATAEQGSLQQAGGRGPGITKKSRSVLAKPPSAKPHYLPAILLNPYSYTRRPVQRKSPPPHPSPQTLWTSTRQSQTSYTLDLNSGGLGNQHAQPQDLAFKLEQRHESKENHLLKPLHDAELVLRTLSRAPTAWTRR